MSQQDQRYNTLDESIHLSELRTILGSLRPKWYNFGLHGLKVPYAELERIKNDHGIEDPLVEVLAWWIRNHVSKPTWPAIVDALLSKGFKRRDIARKVKKEHCPDYISPLERDRPSIFRRFSKVSFGFPRCDSVLSVYTWCIKTEPPAAFS